MRIFVIWLFSSQFCLCHNAFNYLRYSLVCFTMLSIFSVTCQFGKGWRKVGVKSPPPLATPIIRPQIFSNFYVKIWLLFDFTLLHRIFIELYKKSIWPYNSPLFEILYTKCKGVPLRFFSKLINMNNVIFSIRSTKFKVTQIWSNVEKI